MQITISIPFVDEALGHSVIYEEYKGNYAEARRIAEGALGAARQGNDAAILADALLARGVVHLLQGEPVHARDCFGEVERTVPADGDRCLRAVNYAYLATYWQYNLFPDGNGANATELEARWEGRAYAEAEIPRVQAAFARSSDSAQRFEKQFVHDFLPNLQPQRAFVQSSVRSAAGGMTAMLLQAALGSVQGFRETAEVYDAAPALLAYADLAAADLCQRAGDPQSGGQYLQQALNAYAQSEDAAGAAACQMLWGDWLAAPFSTPRALNLAISESNSSGSHLAWTLEAAEANWQKDLLDPARAAYGEAERLFATANAPRGLANVHLRMGYLATLEDDYAAARDHAAQAQEAFEACGDRLGYWLAQAHRILARVGAGELPEEQDVAGAIGAWGAAGGSFSYALGLGLLFGRAGRHWLTREADYERSLACYRLTEALYQALGATSNRAKSLVDQGAVYHALGERAAALNLYEDALEVYVQDIEQRRSAAKAVRPYAAMLANDLYQLYLNEMNADGIERSAKQLKEITSATYTEEGAVVGYALGSMAGSLIEQATVLVPTYRARQAREAGDQETADRLFTQALSAARASSPAQRGLLEAQVLAHQRAYGQAAEAFRQYLGAGGANAGFVGQLASFMQSVAGQQGQLEASRQQRRTHEQAFTFMTRVKEYAEARQHAEALERLAGKKWWQDDPQPWLALSDYAEMYEGLGELDTALDYSDQAISRLEERRGRLSRDELKTALAAGSGVQYLYFQAARTALTAAERARDEAGDPEQFRAYAARALQYAERSKARALLDLMAGSAAIAGSSSAESDAMRAWRQGNAQLTLWRGLLAQERRKDSPDAGRIALLDQRIEAQEHKLHEIETGLAESHPGFYHSIDPKGRLLSLEEICAQLPAEAALLEYHFVGQDLLVWAITRQGIAQARRLAVEAHALARDIRAFHRACMKGEEFEPLGGRLAEVLLEPLAETLDAHPRLIVVPYGAAHALPFHALPWRGEPLASNHTVSYLPSASTLQFRHDRKVWPAGSRLLAVGNPTNMAYRPPLGGDPEPQDGLLGAETEALYVAGLFDEGKALVGPQATEQSVRRELLAGYPYIHFATHGVLSEEAPLLSAILLANGEALNVYELMGLKLDADLVVLSACRTALGEITAGDDVIGLTRGLLGAGARTAVVSLWPVDDVSTSLLMGEFYRNLRAEKPPSVALQAAQNYLRGLDPDQIDVAVAQLRDGGYTRDLSPEGGPTAHVDYSHPHFWAPFILVG